MEDIWVFFDVFRGQLFFLVKWWAKPPKEGCNGSSKGRVLGVVKAGVPKNLHLYCLSKPKKHSI